MITSYFKLEKPIVKKYEYFELYSGFIEPNKFKLVYSEINENLVVNSGRKSLVCIDDKWEEKFAIYSLPKMKWLPEIKKIKDQIMSSYPENEINYGLVHYYHDENATINWHSDREALRSHIYSISLGGTRRFCMRDKKTEEIFTFDLNDGDLFIMKPGCQDRFEHCIKSIKKYNIPRISITFRKVENVLKNYIYDPKNMTVYLTNNLANENVKIITYAKQGINICLKLDSVDNKLFKTNSSVSTKNSSLLKSNLQKAIRRNNKTEALSTCAMMLKENMHIELLRRLSIITFEDVVVNKYFPIIVWYYIAITSKEKYDLTNFDAEFIYSYVGYLCNIATNYIPLKRDAISLNEIIEDPICVALYLRIQFGGFKGEINYMNNLIYDVKNGIHKIEQSNIKHLTFPHKYSVKILDCAIDFHCFPNMISKVLSRIDKKYELTETDIKKYIWDFDSSINYRNDVELSSEREIFWYKVIKPKCDIYRKYIRNMIEF